MKIHFGVWCMLCKSNISHAINGVRRYMKNMEKKHWQAVKLLLMYLWGTSDVWLLYQKDSACEPRAVSYVDLDYDGALDMLRSVTGYVFTLAGNQISWRAIL